MTSRPHNLLASGTKRAIRNRYFVRVGTVGALLCAVALALAIAALVPAYFLAQGELEVLRHEQARYLEGGTAGEGVQRDIAQVRGLVELLTLRATGTSPTAHMAEVLDVRPSAVRVGSMAFDASERTLLVEGTAATRDDLVSYVTLLEAQPTVERVALPLSVYVGSTNAPFTITVYFKSH